MQKLTTFVAVALTLCPGAALPATLTVLNKAEASASLIDLATGKVVVTLPTGVGPHEAATSPDGRFVLAANYGTREAPGSSLTLIDVARGEVVKTIDLGRYDRPHGVQWLGDGRRAVVTAEGKKALLIVDVEAGKVEDVVLTGEDISHMVAVAPDGSRAYVSNMGSGTVSVIALLNGKRVKNVRTGKGAEGIDVSPDGRRVWVTNRDEDTISVIDAMTLRVTHTYPSKTFPIRARMTPDGQRLLVTNGRSADLAVFDTATGAELHRISMQKGKVDGKDKLFGDRFGKSSIPIGIVVDPSGERAWVALAGSDLVAELDLKTWVVTRLLEAGREPDGMAYSPLAARSL